MVFTFNLFVVNRDLNEGDVFDNNSISQLTNQTVNYVFSKSVDDDNYYLSRVIHRAKYN